MACRSIDGQLNDDCWLYIPTDPDRERPYEIMFGDDNDQYQLDSSSALLAVQYRGIVGKIGVHSPAGWIAFADRRTGFVLCMQFPYQPDAEYPDNGATVECWTESPGAPSPIPIRSPGYILEAEVLSPLLTLHANADRDAATGDMVGGLLPGADCRSHGCRLRAPAAIDRPQ